MAGVFTANHHLRFDKNADDGDNPSVDYLAYDIKLNGRQLPDLSHGLVDAAEPAAAQKEEWFV